METALSASLGVLIQKSILGHESVAAAWVDCRTLMLGRSETSAASSFWRRAETVKARVEGATLREARRSERVADCRRAIVGLCVVSLLESGPASSWKEPRYDGHHRSCRSWPIRSGRRPCGPQSPSLTSQSRAEQLLFPAAALLHYNNPIPSPSNSFLILPVLSCQFVKAPAVSLPPLRAFSIFAISLHHHFRSFKVPHHVADSARSVHRRR